MMFSASQKFTGALAFFKEVRSEMKKVNWLERDELVRYTLLVFAVSFAAAAYLGTVDYALNWALREFVL